MSERIGQVIPGRRLGLVLGGDPIAHGAIDLDLYVADTTVVIPPTIKLPASAAGYQWGLLGNDLWGDCVEAAILHCQEVFGLKRGAIPVPWVTAIALSLYSAMSGFVESAGPSGENPTDQGTDPAAAMAGWVKGDVKGHPIVGFGTLAPTSPNIRRAIYEFGGVIYAAALPTTAQAQSQGSIHWRAVEGMVPGSWGGHGINGWGYTPTLLNFGSWGEDGDMDDPFAAACFEAVYVPLSRDTLTSAGVGPGGFNFAQMLADLPGLH